MLGVTAIPWHPHLSYPVCSNSMTQEKKGREGENRHSTLLLTCPLYKYEGLSLAEAYHTKHIRLHNVTHLYTLGKILGYTLNGSLFPLQCTTFDLIRSIWDPDKSSALHREQDAIWDITSLQLIVHHNIKQLIYCLSPTNTGLFGCFPKPVM